jgi:CO/xanthine dehydrogenase Mo-binding subunit
MSSGPRREPFIGRSVANVDGRAIVTGRARFVADLTFTDLAHVHFVRSPLAHARIASIDASEARAGLGVLDVIVPDDVAGLPRLSTGLILDMPILAQRKVRYVDEPVAAVIADSPDAAAAAARLVRVEYEELPPVLDPERAILDGSPLVHDEVYPGVEGNVCWRQATRAGDIDTAFASADLVLERRFTTSKAHAMPMETHGAVASWDPVEGRMTLWTSTQQAHIVRDHVARVFGLDQSHVRVVKPFVGGAFGHKEGLHPHESIAILASMRLGRPVRAILGRREEFAATVSRNPQIRDVAVALRADGTVLGWRDRIVQDCGAYSGLSPSVLALSQWVTAGPYRTPALDIEGVVVYTTKPPSSAFRGFGNPQATFARELMLDIAAHELGLDPAELRRRNYIRVADLPTTNANGLLLKTLPIEEAARRVEEAIGYEALRAQPVPHRGVGLVAMLEWGGGCRWHTDWDSDMSSVTVRLNADGSTVITSDAADSGQGHATAFGQIAADTLGVDPERVRVVLADTDVAPFGLGTYGSRTMVVHGSALVRACEQIRARLMEVAAHRLEADVEDLELAGDRIVITGSDRGVGVADLAAAIHYDRSSLPAGVEPGALVATASYDTDCEVPDADGYGNFAANYTCSATAAVVEVDPDTGKVRVVDWASAEDVGRVIHPDLLEGQLRGGIAQGIGYALGEDLVIDDSGIVLNPSMIDYQVPTAPEVPMIRRDRLIPIESRDPTHPLQHKGVGESGITPAAAAIACAVYDAIGVAIQDLPLSPEKVLRAMEAGRQPGGPA